MSATRRDVLRGLGGLALTLSCRPPPARAPAPGDGKRLITRMDDPYCAEPPLDALCRTWITPVPLFFVLDHAAAPAIDVGRWRLEVVGRVRRPQRLTLRELRRLAAINAPATLVCAGNRRREHDARRDVDDPLLWDAGAIGNARWTGPRLDAVLDLAGVAGSGGHVWFEGLDGFGGSIPLERVAGRDAPPVILAYGMNGGPLPALHGHPLRAVVPGYVAARSVKWLSRIVVADRPSPSAHFADGHRIDARPIYPVAINSAIAAARARGASVEVGGYAIASAPEATVDRVELSADDGATWTPAELIGPATPGCWRLWRATIARRGGARLVARAIDTRGAVQPREAAWNPGGYLYNGWPSITL